jgi:Concanavalin A-like lectin/glucanases superfamily/Acyltransferase family
MGLAVASVALAGRALPRPARVLDRFPGLCWLIAGAALLLVTQLDLMFRLGDHVAASAAFSGHALYGLIAVALVVPAVFGDQRRGLVRRVLRSRALLWIGTVSYGLYLWHQAAIGQLQRWDVDGALAEVLPFPPALVLLPLALAASLALAWLSFVLVERPAQRLGRSRVDGALLRRVATGLVLGGALLLAGVVAIDDVRPTTAAGALVVAATLVVLARRTPGPRALAALGAALVAIAVAAIVLTAPGLAPTQTGDRSKAAHVALAYDGRELELWVDGQLRATRDAAGPVAPGSEQIEVGSYAGGAVWDGAIDEVAVYGRALTRDEITALHRAGRGYSAGPGAAVGLMPALATHLDLGNARTFDGTASTVRIDARRLAPLDRAFTVEAWATRRPGNVDAHGAVIARVGAWDVQTDALGRWAAGIRTADGDDHRVATKQSVSELAGLPVVVRDRKPTPDPALFALLAGVLLLVAARVRALVPAAAVVTSVPQPEPGEPLPRAA